jgi:hypothetical protein
MVFLNVLKTFEATARKYVAAPGVGMLAVNGTPAVPEPMSWCVVSVNVAKLELVLYSNQTCVGVPLAYPMLERFAVHPATGVPLVAPRSACPPVWKEMLFPSEVPKPLLATTRATYVVKVCNPVRVCDTGTAVKPLPIPNFVVVKVVLKSELTPYSIHTVVALPFGVTVPLTAYASGTAGSNPKVKTLGGPGVVKLRMAPRAIRPPLLATAR